MAHARTVFELSPGLNVLTGPNNTGKSAVVEALRCLAQNPPPRHVIRHGAGEARVTAELADGTVVAWVRRPKYALYELTRPGAAEPEVFAKFGRTPPEEIVRTLGLAPVAIEGGDAVDVHIGNQREPVFLLNQPGSALAGFFAASTEAAHLIAMQNLLTDRIKKARTESRRQERRLADLATELDRLAPLPDLDMRLEAAGELEAALGRHEARTGNLAVLLAARADLTRRAGARERAGLALATLAAPPVPAATAPLAAHVADRRALGRRLARAEADRAALAPLAAPPALADAAGLARHLADRARLDRGLARCDRRAVALAGLPTSPELGATAALGATIDRLRTGRAALAGLDAKSRALSRLPQPPTTRETRPLAELTAALGAARAAVSAAAKTLERRSAALEALAARLRERVAALGFCPLCGAPLRAEDFLDAGCGHGHGNGEECAS